MDRGERVPVGRMTNAPRLAVVPRVDARAQRATGAELFHAFHAAGIRYCFWKSDPDELERGLHGASDLDILIDRAQSLPAQDALARSGFKRLTATAGKAYPGVEDYLALDPVSGALLHCHAHYRLLIGRANLKEYRLPWEELLLTTRQLDARTGVYVPDPDVELPLLLLQFAAKVRLRDLVPALGRSPVGAEVRARVQRLRPRANRARSRALCVELLGARPAARLLDLLDHLDEPRRAIGLAWLARGALHPFRRYGRVSGLAHRWARRIAWIAGGLAKRSLRVAWPLRRTVPTGGVLVAVLGPDGSGKSTVTRDLAACFATKLDVLLVYFGSGDGPSSLVRWPLLAARRALKRMGLRPPPRRAPREPAGLGARVEHGAARSGIVWAAARLVWSLVLSLEKRRKLRTAWRARNRGMLVITDRYPQAQVLGFNDGPLLAAWADRPGGLLHWLAQWEAAPYAWADRHPPDLIVKLNVNPQTALRRKPETDASEVERRLRAVRTLEYPPPAVIGEVDADRPLRDVSLDVRRLVWNRI